MRILTTLLCASALLIFGCDDGGSGSSTPAGASSSGGGAGSPSTFETEVAETGPVSDWDDASIEQACGDGEAAVDAALAKLDSATAKEGGCKTAGAISAAFGGGSAEVCQTAYDECMATPDQTGEAEEESTCAADVIADKANCTATLDELKACMAENLANIDAQVEAMKVLATKSCEDIAAESEGAETGTEPTTEESDCTTAQQKCPAMFN